MLFYIFILRFFLFLQGLCLILTRDDKLTEVSTGTLAANNHDKQQILGTPASDRRVHILTAFNSKKPLSTTSGLKALFTLPLGKKQKEH